jgi:hypothetical protein
MKRSHKMVFAVPAAALLAGWWLWTGRNVTPPAPSEVATESSSVAPAAGKIDQQKLREVEALIAEKNREASKDRQAFLDDGWEMVNVPAPDQRVVGYDPKLLDQGREQELRMQMASTVPAPAETGRLAEIARRAKDEATRYAAVEALGRLNAPESTEALYEVLTEGNLDVNDSARAQIPALLRPATLDDTLAAKVAMLLDNPSLTMVEKQQIAFTLALIGLRDGMTLSAQVEISPSARALIEQMTDAAKLKFAQAILHKGGHQ